MKRRKRPTKYKVYWSEAHDPKRWPPQDWVYVPFAGWMCRYRFTLFVVKKYLGFRLWLRRASVEL